MEVERDEFMAGFDDFEKMDTFQFEIALRRFVCTLSEAHGMREAQTGGTKWALPSSLAMLGRDAGTWKPNEVVGFQGNLSLKFLDDLVETGSILAVTQLGKSGALEFKPDASDVEHLKDMKRREDAMSARKMWTPLIVLLIFVFMGTAFVLLANSISDDQAVHAYYYFEECGTLIFFGECGTIRSQPT